MHIAADRGHRLLYRRSGFPDIELRLGADGIVVNPPGHAEARWVVPVDGELAFCDSAGAVTATLCRDGERCYRGTLLDRYQAELRELPPRPPRRPGPMRYCI